MMSDVAVHRADNPFTRQADQPVGSTLMPEPIRRTHRPRLFGSTANQNRRRDRDVIYTSRGSSIRPREGIQRHRVDHVTSDLDQEDGTRDGEYQSTTSGRRSRENGASTNAGDRFSTTSSKPCETFRCDCDCTPSWRQNQRRQKTVSRKLSCYISSGKFETNFPIQHPASSQFLFACKKTSCCSSLR